MGRPSGKRKQQTKLETRPDGREKGGDSRWEPEQGQAVEVGMSGLLCGDRTVKAGAADMGLRS